MIHCLAHFDLPISVQTTLPIYTQALFNALMCVTRVKNLSKTTFLSTQTEVQSAYIYLLQTTIAYEIALSISLLLIAGYNIHSP